MRKSLLGPIGLRPHHQTLSWQSHSADIVVRHAAGPTLRLDIEGHVKHCVYIASSSGHDAFVQVGEEVLELSPVERFPGAEEDAEGAGCLAPMPGKVLRVNTQVGDSVAEGQTLIVLEAMKMEHAIASPRDGVVATVLVSEGELVEAQAPLFELEED